MVLVALVLAAVLPLAVLTAVGARRRGRSIPLAVLAGIGFPVAWAAWYLVDERPYRRDARRVW
jgi:hypothetical protein